MTLFDYGKNVLKAWDNFIEALLYNSLMERLAKRVVERGKQ